MVLSRGRREDEALGEPGVPVDVLGGQLADSGPGAQARRVDEISGYVDDTQAGGVSS